MITPLLMKAQAGEMIAVSVPAMVVAIAQMVLVPTLLGLGFHHLTPELRRWIEPVLPTFSMAGIVAMTVLAGAAGQLVASPAGRRPGGRVHGHLPDLTVVPASTVAPRADDRDR